MGDKQPLVVKGRFDKLPIVVSEPDPYESQPPRLVVAIDDSQADAPEGTKFVDYLAARHQADAARARQDKNLKYASKVGAPMAKATTPLGHVIHVQNIPSQIPKSLAIEEWDPIPATKPGHEVVIEILQWVQDKLEVDSDKFWESQNGPQIRWWTPTPGAEIKPDINPKAEETWARLTTELLLGITYAGPGDTYAMGSASSNKKRPPSGRWDGYIYQRLEPGHPVESPWIDPRSDLLHGDYHVPSWRDPYPAAPARPTVGDVSFSNQHELEEATKQYWSWQNNDDPVAPVVAACQHLTTLVAVMRGYPLSWMGTATYGAVGYQASDAVKSYPIFGTVESPAGYSPYGAARKLIEENVGLVPPGKGKWLRANQNLLPKIVTVDGQRMAQWSAIQEDEMVPGTIFVWDPDQGFDDGMAFDESGESEGVITFGKPTGQNKKNAPLTIYMTEFESLFEVRATFAAFFKKRTTAGVATFGGSEYLIKNQRQANVPTLQQKQRAYAFISSQINLYDGRKRELEERIKREPWAKEKLTKDKEEAGRQYDHWMKKGLTIESIISNVATDVPVPYTPQQLPGSHITTVLRTTPDRKALQLLDTNFGAHRDILYQTGSEAILPKTGQFIADGYRHPDAIDIASAFSQVSDRLGKTFAGVGIPAPPPASRTLANQIEHLKKVRSVGLVRFALTRRVDVHLLSSSDILFVSALRPMYNHDRTNPTNYPVAKLLWSLRNTPAFTNLQPWWLVYVPKGLLARCMYAQGGREMKLKDFIERFRDSNDSHVEAWFPRYGLESWPPSDKSTYDACKSAQHKGKLYSPRHYSLIVVLTNHGSENPAFAGKAKYHARYKYVEGNSGQASDGETVPGSLKFAAENLSWDQMHVHEKIDAKLLVQLLPSFFQVEQPKPFEESEAGS